MVMIVVAVVGMVRVIVITVKALKTVIMMVILLMSMTIMAMMPPPLIVLLQTWQGALGMYTSIGVAAGDAFLEWGRLNSYVTWGQILIMLVYAGVHCGVIAAGKKGAAVATEIVPGQQPCPTTAQLASQAVLILYSLGTIDGD